MLPAWGQYSATSASPSSAKAESTAEPTHWSRASTTWAPPWFTTSTTPASQHTPRPQDSKVGVIREHSYKDTSQELATERELHKLEQAECRDLRRRLATIPQAGAFVADESHPGRSRAEILQREDIERLKLDNNSLRLQAEALSAQAEALSSQLHEITSRLHSRPTVEELNEVRMEAKSLAMQLHDAMMTVRSRPSAEELSMIHHEKARLQAENAWLRDELASRPTCQDVASLQHELLKARAEIAARPPPEEHSELAEKLRYTVEKERNATEAVKALESRSGVLMLDLAAAQDALTLAASRESELAASLAERELAMAEQGSRWLGEIAASRHTEAALKSELMEARAELRSQKSEAWLRNLRATPSTPERRATLGSTTSVRARAAHIEAAFCRRVSGHESPAVHSPALSARIATTCAAASPVLVMDCQRLHRTPESHAARSLHSAMMTQPTLGQSRSGSNSGWSTPSRNGYSPLPPEGRPVTPKLPSRPAHLATSPVGTASPRLDAASESNIVAGASGGSPWQSSLSPHPVDSSQEVEALRFGPLRYLARGPSPCRSGAFAPAGDALRAGVVVVADAGDARSVDDCAWVLLLPGAAGRAEHWMPQLQSEAWSASVRVLAVDYPGSGDRDSVMAKGGPCLSSDDAARLLWELVDADRASLLGRNGQRAAAAGVSLSIVGLSFGGMVAQKMAAQRPTDVTSLVLLNTYPGIALGARPWPFYIRGLVWLSCCALSLCSMDKASSDLNEAWLLWGPSALRMAPSAFDSAAAILAQASSPKTRAGGMEAMVEWVRRRFGDFAFVAAVLRHSLSPGEVSRLRALAVNGRCLVLVGARDWLVRPANGRLLASLLSCELIEFPQCGHFVQLEAPEELSDLLARVCVQSCER